MSKRHRYHDHVDPEHQRWGRTYPGFPGVAECVRLVQSGKAEGAWIDLIVLDLAINASDCLVDLLETYRREESDRMRLIILMALELAALPDSIEFLSEVLRQGDPRLAPYALHGLKAIDSKASRRALRENN